MTDDDIEIADKIHYPMCWDDVAYPTLASALWELLADAETVCPTCGKTVRYHMREVE